MKITNKTLFLIYTLVIIYLNSINSKSSTELKHYITPMIKHAKDYLSYVNLPYCNK